MAYGTLRPCSLRPTGRAPSLFATDTKGICINDATKFCFHGVKSSMKETFLHMGQTNSIPFSQECNTFHFPELVISAIQHTLHNLPQHAGKGLTKQHNLGVMSICFSHKDTQLWLLLVNYSDRLSSTSGDSLYNIRGCSYKETDISLQH